MNDARETILATVSPLTNRPNMLTDAIIEAMPDIIRGMVKPLVWEDMGHYRKAKTVLGDYEAGWDDGAWASCDGPSMWEWSSGDDHRSLSEHQAQQAAQDHHVAQLLSGLGIGGDA